MTIKIYIKGDFLDIYPYMNWIFLLTQDGDLLSCRTEQLIENQELHNHLFRQGLTTKEKTNKPTNETVTLRTDKFKKIAKIADKYSFSDLRFFYSNIICGSNKGLQFIPFDTKTEKTEKEQKITDAPISSISAKFKTIFASSFEAKLTTLYGVREGNYSKIKTNGPETTRVGISNKQIHYYSGASNLQLALYTKTKSESKTISKAEENEAEQISAIGDAEPFHIENIKELKNTKPDFVFNSNNGLYLKLKNKLYYYKDGTEEPFIFNINNNGKLIKAHLLAGKKCYEFLDGLYLEDGNKIINILPEECISSRGYQNSINYKDMISAVSDNGAYLFRI